jgi:hypothetical protein
MRGVPPVWLAGLGATPMADRTPDECMEKIWGIANGNPDYCEPHVRAFSDMWWGVWIECAHGKFKGESVGLCDVSTAFLGAMSDYWRAHPESSAYAAEEPPVLPRPKLITGKYPRRDGATSPLHE